MIHRAVDLARFDPAAVASERLAEKRQLPGIGTGDLIVLLAGRITRRKAQAHLVEAAGLLKARGVEGFTCIFAGEIEKPDYMAEIEARVRALGLDAPVRFPNLADMPAAYLLADVSLNISEAEGLRPQSSAICAGGTTARSESMLLDGLLDRVVALQQLEAPSGLQILSSEGDRRSEAYSWMV